MPSCLNGNCYLCGAELGKTAMKNHILKAHSSADGGQDCCLLKIEGAENKNYWLLIDIPAEKTLTAVDKFMRKIWLECCGHMSAFYAAGYREIAKSRKVGSFPVGAKLLHEYDFGTTTECVITFMGYTRRPQQRELVRLLARNIPPQFRCDECGSPAEYICTQCIFDSDNPFYCAECGEKHEHEELLLPVTNSPRMGECGYCGELDTYAYISATLKPGEDKT